MKIILVACFSFSQSFVFLHKAQHNEDNLSQIVAHDEVTNIYV